MSGSLTEQQVAAYRQLGYVWPIRVLPEQVAAALLAQVPGTQTEAGAALARMADCHLSVAWVRSLAEDPRVLGPVESLLGSDLICCGAQLFIKEPGAPTFLSWHQDGAYWGEDACHVVTCWIALTASVPENGCVRVLRGTGAQLLRHRETFAPHNPLSRGQEAEVAVEPDAIVDLVLNPGEMSLHSALIVHGSAPNRTRARRVGLALRYSPSSRALLDPGTGVTRVRVSTAPGSTR